MALVQKSFSDLITFTRSTGGGRFNAQGQYEWLSANAPRIDYDPVTGECKGLLIEESRTNLFTSSDRFVGAWSPVARNMVIADNVAYAPDGTLKASRIQATAAGQARIEKGAGAYVAGETYTESVHAKAATEKYLFLSVFTGIENFAIFDLSTGQVASSAASVTPKIEPSSNGFWRCAITVTMPNSGSNNFKIGVTSSATGFASAEIGNSIYIWGPQIEKASFPTSYIPTPSVFQSRSSTATYLDSNGVLQTAATNVARDQAYGYDENGTLRKIGLLVEEQRTNLVTSSVSSLGAGPGTLKTVTSNASVLGGKEIKVEKTESATNTGYLSSSNITVPAGVQTFTVWCIAKPGNVSKFTLQYTGGAAVTYNNGALSYSQYGGFSGKATLAGKVSNISNGYMILELTVTTTADFAGTAGAVWLMCHSGSNIGAVGDYVYFLDLVQFEMGATRTSYIPTTTAQVTRAADTSTSSQVTRAADIASVNKLSPWYNPEQGTLFVEFVPHPAYPVAGKGLVAAQFGDGTFANRISLNSSTGNFNANFDVALDNNVRRTNVGQYVQGVNKIAGAYSLNEATSSLNGSPSSTTTLVAVPQVTRLYIGQDHMAAHINGHIRSLRFYPKRLSNSELQAMTA